MKYRKYKNTSGDFEFVVGSRTPRLSSSTKPLPNKKVNGLVHSRCLIGDGAIDILNEPRKSPENLEAVFSINVDVDDPVHVSIFNSYEEKKRLSFGVISPESDFLLFAYGYIIKSRGVKISTRKVQIEFTVRSDGPWFFQKL
jgi:hypothetical protein